MKEGIKSKSYTEVYEILNKLGDNFINKIPKEIYSLIENSRDTEYKPKVFLDDNKINKKEKSREALALFAFLNIAYIADEESKKELLKIYNENEEKEIEILKEMFGKESKSNTNIKNNEIEEKVIKEEVDIETKEETDDNKDNKDENEELYKEQSLTLSKESLFKRIFNKIKNFFKIKK